MPQLILYNGATGQAQSEKSPMNSESPCLRAFSLLLPILLIGACSSDLSEPLQSGRVVAWQGQQGRWVGPVTPAEPGCGTTTNGLMTIGRQRFGFDPFGSSAVIQGDVGADGSLKGTLVREGKDREKLTLEFDGVASGSGTVDGVLHSARCRWTVSLHRG